MVRFFWGRSRTTATATAAEYEPLPPSDAVALEEEATLQPRPKPRVFGLGKILIRTGKVVFLGTILMVVTCLILYGYESTNWSYIDPFEGYGGTPDENVEAWVDELSPFVTPVMVHSHNDYMRPHPLFTALASGCASVEADVWLSKDGSDLFVAHHWWSRSESKTLRSLYIDPLVHILDAMNDQPALHHSDADFDASGVFSIAPNKTLILFIDVKDDPEKTWPVVLEQLKPLREKGYLSKHEIVSSPTSNQTFWPGPITVVGTGNIANHRDTNFGPDLKKWQQHHDAFLDAPLNQLDRPGYCAKKPKMPKDCIEVQPNEFYTASVSLLRAVGPALFGFSKSQLKTIQEQVRAAKQHNLLARYWETPSWPRSYRNYVWNTLLREGEGLLNADDVYSATRKYIPSGTTGDIVSILGTASFLASFTFTLYWLVKRMLCRGIRLRG